MLDRGIGIWRTADGVQKAGRHPVVGAIAAEPDALESAIAIDGHPTIAADLFYAGLDQHDFPLGSVVQEVRQ